MDFRPHILTWTPLSPSTTEPGTGYEILGVPAEKIAVLCRFHLGGTKEYRNEDNAVILQKGSIRVDDGAALPPVNWPIQIYETEPVTIGGNVIMVDGEEVQIKRHVHFEGRVLDIFRGQLTWRLDV